MTTRIGKLMFYYILLACISCIVYAALSGHAQAAETAVTASQTLTTSLVDIIQQVCGGVKQGGSFLQQQIPDVVKQLLIWKLAESLVLLALCLLSVTSYIVGVVKVWNHRGANEFMPPLLVLGILFILIPGLCIAVLSLLTALKIYIAPKVWLIEYAASLVK
jgi:hypothetical protein